MSKYTKYITELSNKKEEHDVSIRIVGSYDSLEQCKYASSLYGWWISPDGKVHDIEKIHGHAEFINDHKNLFDVSDKDYMNFFSLYDAVISRGWIRGVNGSPHHLSFELTDNMSTKHLKLIQDLLLTIKPATYVRIASGDFDYDVPYDALMSARGIRDLYPYRKSIRRISKKAAEYGWWLSPEGKLYKVGFEMHGHFVGDNIDLFKDTSAGDTYSIAFDNEWIRIVAIFGSLDIQIPANSDKYLKRIQDILPQLPRPKTGDIFLETFYGNLFIRSKYQDFVGANNIRELKKLSLPFGKISKRAADELIVINDPAEDAGYYKKVLEYIDENLKTIKDKNQTQWLQKKKHEVLSKIKDTENKKPVFEWVDYDKKLTSLKEELKKVTKKLSDFENKTMSGEDMNNLLDESEDLMMQPIEVLKMNIEELKDQIDEYSKAPEEIEKWDEYYKKHGPISDEMAKYEATPPNPNPEEAYWTPEGEIKRYEEILYPGTKKLSKRANDLSLDIDQYSKRLENQITQWLYPMSGEEISYSVDEVLHGTLNRQRSNLNNISHKINNLDHWNGSSIVVAPLVADEENLADPIEQSIVYVGNGGAFFIYLGGNNAIDISSNRDVFLSQDERRDYTNLINSIRGISKKSGPGGFTRRLPQISLRDEITGPGKEEENIYEKELTKQENVPPFEYEDIGSERDYNVNPIDLHFDREVDMEDPFISPRNVIRFFLMKHFKRDKYKYYIEKMLSKLLDVQPSKFFDLGLFEDDQLKQYEKRAMLHTAYLEPQYFMKYVVPNFNEAKLYNSIAEESLQSGESISERRRKLLGHKIISKRAAVLDYPKNMLDEIAEWVEKTAPTLAKRIFKSSPDVISETFDIDISDTNQYKKHAWLRRIFGEAQSIGLEKELEVRIYRANPYKNAPNERGALYQYHDNKHIISVFYTLEEIQYGDIKNTLRHELVHMMQEIISRTIHAVEEGENFGQTRPAGLPTNYNPKLEKLYEDEPSKKSLFNELGEHSKSDIEFFPILATEINNMRQYVSIGKNLQQRKERLKLFINSSMFLAHLRDYDKLRYNKAIRELYRAFDEAQPKKLSARASSVQIDTDKVNKFKNILINYCMDLVSDDPNKEYTRQEVEKDLAFVFKKVDVGLAKAKQDIEQAISRVNGWNNTPVHIYLQYPLDLRYEWWSRLLDTDEGPPISYGVDVGIAYFMYSLDGDVDDVLDIGIENEDPGETWFSNDTQKSDYYSLIYAIRNKDVKEKNLTLYTSRPQRDRDTLLQYAKHKQWPRGIWLTKNINLAYSFGADYGSTNDLWKVVVSSKNVMEDPATKGNYQLYGNGMVNIISAVLIGEGQKSFASISKRAHMKDPLSSYKKKRDFEKTPEPEGKVEGKNQYRFVIQEHDAEKAGKHFDLRLENDKGTMSSWAIPKAKLPGKGEKLLAKKTEDHPISYMNFKGDIKEGYGKGKVNIWTKGKYKEVEYTNKKVLFEVFTGKFKGNWALIHTGGDNWLFMHHNSAKKEAYLSKRAEPKYKIYYSVYEILSMNVMKVRVEDAKTSNILDSKEFKGEYKDIWNQGVKYIRELQRKYYPSRVIKE